MTQNIIISKLEKLQAKNGSPYISIHDTAGEKYSVWPNPENKALFETASRLQVGRKISIGFETNGNFKNATMIVPSDDVSLAEVFAPITKGIPPPFNDKKDRRISRLASINSAIAFFDMLQHYGVKEIPNGQKVLDTASEFEAWVYREAEE